MNKNESIGGRAYSNGVQLMNSSKAVKAYYNKAGDLKVDIKRSRKIKKANFLKKIPVIRGILSIFIALWVFLKEVLKNPIKYWFIFLIILFDLIFWFGGNGEVTTFRALFLLSYFFLPLFLIFYFRNNISEVLKFHGAEHMAVNYYENDCQGQIKNYSRIHKSCGSNFIFYFILFQIIGSLLALDLNIIIRQLLYIGLAYEAMKYTPDSLLFIVTIIQRFVAKKPDKKQIIAAEKALNVLMDEKVDNYI
ncbi:DUF1385 domain-containing protein [Halanaerobium hydrogeniformans]|uniref:Metal-dependent enzyme n=1 Tax=Halanaerobium hydrogeniformans TaxID=656519 RepID=E4RK60_HALHG|nr:DUF1385 domain-containing protein [Halanaerobium hydrogeniformans]ADQ14612.1 protein of unknown function DUF1385 [Halanaerobium hydrogeniformans]